MEDVLPPDPDYQRASIAVAGYLVTHGMHAGSPRQGAPARPARASARP